MLLLGSCEVREVIDSVSEGGVEEKGAVQAP